MFLLKKIVTIFIMPLSIGLITVCAGIVLLWFSKHQNRAKVLVTIGVIWIILVSFNPLTNAMLSPLEHTYPRYEHPTIPVRYVSVLGGGHISDQTIPLSSQLGKGSVVRLVEGVRIQRENPGSKLILSGFGGVDSVANAVVMARVAIALGVDSATIIIETRPKDTEEESVLVGAIVGSEPFVLVTSASHLKRATALFRSRGCNPIPAPTDFESYPFRSPRELMPNSNALGKSERWVYETVGMIWLKLRGKV
jgi:uncharacterized SAM-binding protein YcdF (DUF218 family)